MLWRFYTKLMQVISSMRVLMTEDSNNAESSSFLLDDNSWWTFLHPSFNLFDALMLSNDRFNLKRNMETYLFPHLESILFSNRHWIKTLRSINDLKTSSMFFFCCHVYFLPYLRTTAKMCSHDPWLRMQHPILGWWSFELNPSERFLRCQTCSWALWESSLPIFTRVRSRRLEHALPILCHSHFKW